MIIALNNMIPDTIKILCAIQANLEFDFYLTGSRYFRCATEESDYDFFVEVGEKESEFLNFLEENGFESYTGDYTDTSIIGVYRYKKGNDQIDIQVVKDAKLKNDAQSILKMFRKHPTKKEWDFMLHKLSSLHNNLDEDD